MHQVESFRRNDFLESDESMNNMDEEVIVNKDPQASEEKQGGQFTFQKKRPSLQVQVLDCECTEPTQEEDVPESAVLDCLPRK